eukprot:3909170-Prymnesium_polylepis.1
MLTQKAGESALAAGRLATLKARRLCAVGALRRLHHGRSKGLAIFRDVHHVAADIQTAGLDSRELAQPDAANAHIVEADAHDLVSG